PDGCSSGKAPLAGAGFEVWSESNGCLGLQTASVTCHDGGLNDNTTVSADTKVKSQQLTVLSGSGVSTVATTCFGGLAKADYYLHESSAPSGYAAGADQVVTVSTAATCSSTSGQATATVEDKPLTDLAVSATSEVAGATSSTITCKNLANATVTPDTGST